MTLSHHNLPQLLATGPLSTSSVQTLLFRQSSGEFFALYEPLHKGQPYAVEALTPAEAKAMFEMLPAAIADFATCVDAFGDKR